MKNSWEALRKVKQLLICLTLSVSFTACTLGPNYQRPCMDIPESYTYGFEEEAMTLDTAWWEQFDDPVLTQLLLEAARSNYDIKTAAARVDQALGDLVEQRANLFPQLGYQGDYTRTYRSSTAFGSLPFSVGFKNPYNDFELAATGSWDLDLFGRIKRITEAAMANVYGAEQARKAVTLSVASLTAITYLKLLGLDAQLEVAQETLEAYQEELTYFETQYKYGQASMMMVVQAKTQYEIASATIPQVQLEIVKTEHTLTTLLGKNPSSIPRGKTIYALKLPPIPESIPSEILCQRPDVLKAEYDLVSANALIGAAKALYFPDINLTGAFGTASQELSSLFTGPARTWTYTGSLVGPIFTFGNISGQVQQAEAEYEALLNEYKNTVIGAFADVENALASHDYLQKQFEAQKKLVEASGQYVYYAQLQFKGGYSPYFVVLQAQEQYFPAQLSWIQTRAALLISIINSYQAMGGGWVDLIQ